MSDTATALLRQEYRAARRLARLFRIERSGRIARWPSGIARRLIDRRGRLIDEMVRLEQRRRSLEPWSSVELELAMGTLAREVDRTEQHCLERLAELGAELERRRGVGTATGLRDVVDGRLLGSG
jgi:hypothetical protein